MRYVGGREGNRAILADRPFPRVRVGLGRSKHARTVPFVGGIWAAAGALPGDRSEGSAAPSSAAAAAPEVNGSSGPLLVGARMVAYYEVTILRDTADDADTAEAAAAARPAQAAASAGRRGAPAASLTLRPSGRVGAPSSLSLPGGARPTPVPQPRPAPPSVAEDEEAEDDTDDEDDDDTDGSDSDNQPAAQPLPAPGVGFRFLGRRPVYMSNCVAVSMCS